MNELLLLSGTTAGFDHRNHPDGIPVINKGHQDHTLVSNYNGQIVAGFLADGSSSGVGSKGGAMMMAHIFNTLFKELGKRRRTPNPEKLLRMWEERLVATMRRSAKVFGNDHVAADRALMQLWGATSLGFFVLNDQVVFFGCGDGYIVVDDEVTELKALKSNTPEYLAYRALYSVPVGYENVGLRVLKIVPLDKIAKGILVCSDGVPALLDGAKRPPIRQDRDSWIVLPLLSSLIDPVYGCEEMDDWANGIELRRGKPRPQTPLDIALGEMNRQYITIVPRKEGGALPQLHLGVFADDASVIGFVKVS